MFAGSDTTASALSRTIQMLTEDTDVQDALRKELLDAGQDADVSTLPLLDAVCRETLRLYPPAQISQRVYVSYLSS
jgi:cytochrome P450